MLAGSANWSTRAGSDVNEFLSMGGYAAFVWSALAITFVVLLANIVLSARELRLMRRRARRHASLEKSGDRQQP